jgi:hypothetical protein
LRAAFGLRPFEASEADCRGMDWRARYGVAIAQSVYLEGWKLGNDEHERLKTMNCD